MRLWRLATALAGVLVLAACVIVWVLARPLPVPDVAGLNDLRARILSVLSEETGVSGTGGLSGRIAAALPEGSPPLTVLGPSGEVLFSSAPELSSELAAVRENAHVLPLHTGEQGEDRTSLLLVENTLKTASEARLQQTLAVALSAIAAIGLVLAVGLWRVHRRVLSPFRRLQGFAGDVAGGDLDTPLPMDQGNAFGAFSESFDVMRTELKRARDAEQAARAENREVLAQLGHDIRTPVAVIQATSEVLELGESDPGRLERFGTIRTRTSQVDRMVSELIRTSEEEATALSVRIETHTSRDLADLIRGCDADGVIGPFALPECLVDYDAERLGQVFDNLLSNTRKFAGGPLRLDATAVVAEGGARLLRMRLADSGPGVAAHELGAILGRGVRGSNAHGIPGSGLGLFTAAQLVERMGGELAVENAANGTGFVVILLLPFSG